MNIEISQLILERDLKQKYVNFDKIIKISIYNLKNGWIFILILLYIIIFHKFHIKTTLYKAYYLLLEICLNYFRIYFISIMNIYIAYMQMHTTYIYIIIMGDHCLIVFKFWYFSSGRKIIGKHYFCHCVDILYYIRYSMIVLRF